jgi:hypothetical protein
MEELEKQLAELMKECSLRSGTPSYLIFDRRRKLVIQQLELLRALTRIEFINLHGYKLWLSFCAQHGLPENHPVAEVSVELSATS